MVNTAQLNIQSLISKNHELHYSLPWSVTYQLLDCRSFYAWSCEMERKTKIWLQTYSIWSSRQGTVEVEGGKDLFYHMILELATFYPNTTASLMAIVPHYGCYKDWFKIIELARDEHLKTFNHKVQSAINLIVDTIMKLACAHLIKDDRIFACGKTSSEISLLAKWAPREGKSIKSWLTS